MTDNVVHLGAERFGRSERAREVKPEEALLYVLREIREGRAKPTGIYIALVEEPDDHHQDFSCAIAGLQTLEAVGLLTKHISMMLEINRE